MLTQKIDKRIWVCEKCDNIERVSKIYNSPHCRYCRVVMIELIKKYQPKWVCSWVRGPGNPAGNINGSFFIPYWEPCLIYGDLGTIKAKISDTWKIPQEYNRNGHPCPKSITLIKTIIQCGEWRSVFDPFMGSGTTAVACKELGKQYIGIEISPDYCKIIENRLAQEVLL